MNNWWKNPVLQGEDNDYGQYDYLVEELPHDEAKWELGCSKCDSCGKYHRLNFYSIHYFYTMDGYDHLIIQAVGDVKFGALFIVLRRKLKRKLKLINWRFLC